MQEDNNEAEVRIPEDSELLAQYYAFKERLRQNGLPLSRYINVEEFEQAVISKLEEERSKEQLPQIDSTMDFNGGQFQPTSSESSNLTSLNEMNNVRGPQILIDQEMPMAFGAGTMSPTTSSHSTPNQSSVRSPTSMATPMRRYLQKYLVNEELKMIYDFNIMAPMTSDDLMRMEDKSCMVCAELGTGLHYGKWTCGGCKAFFKRTVQGRLEYECIGSTPNTCDIHNRTRRVICRKCRFRKCILVGMSPAGVRGNHIVGGRTSLHVYNQDYSISDDELDQSHEESSMVPTGSLEPSPSFSTDPSRSDSKFHHVPHQPNTTPIFDSPNSASTSAFDRGQFLSHSLESPDHVDNCPLTQTPSRNDPNQPDHSLPTIETVTASSSAQVSNNPSPKSEEALDVIRKMKQKAQRSVILMKGPIGANRVERRLCSQPPSPNRAKSTESASMSSSEGLTSSAQDQSLEGDGSILRNLLLHPTLLRSQIEQYLKLPSVDPVNFIQSATRTQALDTLHEEALLRNSSLDQELKTGDDQLMPQSVSPSDSISPHCVKDPITPSHSDQSPQTSLTPSTLDANIGTLKNQYPVQKDPPQNCLTSWGVESRCSEALLSKTEILAILKISKSWLRQCNLEGIPRNFFVNYQKITDLMRSKYGAFFEKGSQRYLILFLVIILIHSSNFWAHDAVKDAGEEVRRMTVNHYITTRLQDMAYPITDDIDILIKRIAELTAVLTSFSGVQQEMFGSILVAYSEPFRQTTSTDTRFTDRVIKILMEMDSSILPRIHPYLILKIFRICCKIGESKL